MAFMEILTGNTKGDITSCLSKLSNFKLRIPSFCSYTIDCVPRNKNRKQAYPTSQPIFQVKCYYIVQEAVIRRKRLN